MNMGIPWQLAMLRGFQGNLHLAEAFEVIRMVNKLEPKEKEK
jgi:hypothetical protein